MLGPYISLSTFRAEHWTQARRLPYLEGNWTEIQTSTGRLAYVRPLRTLRHLAYRKTGESADIANLLPVPLGSSDGNPEIVIGITGNVGIELWESQKFCNKSRALQGMLERICQTTLSLCNTMLSLCLTLHSLCTKRFS